MIEATANPDGERSQSRLPFEQVASLCETFTQDWKLGRPDIPSYLDRVTFGSKDTLFRNLLMCELQRLHDQGERPRADDYLQRFPEFDGIVRDVFLEATASSLVADHERVPIEPVDQKPLPASRLGDYRLIRELGRGGMGVVFEAVHVRRGNRVALKMLPQVDGPRLYRFKREFRSAADLSHPNLIGLHNLEVDGAQWFFTMDLIEGVDFLDHVRPSDQLDTARLSSAVSQLVSGVMALHRNHIIHRDLKPSNVMVARDGQVILLDFGLVIETQLSGPSQSIDRIQGTPSYMAPEQAAGLAVTPACDWYAVGVMLYEALSGKRPFGGSLWEILQAKQTCDPPPLTAEATTPTHLASLTIQLLARDPRQRPDAFEIIKRISTGIGPTSTVSTSPRDSHLVGRESHLAALNEVYRSVRRNGDPQTVFIVGRSGEGKTTLGEHFLASLHQDPRTVIMAGRCYDRESVPFKALDALIDALAGYLRALHDTDAALLMPDDVGILARVFPVLQRVEIVAKSASRGALIVDEQRTRQRAFAALRALLIRLSRRSPVIWFIDDLQWGDADSADVLFEVLRPPEAPQVLLVGTYRSDEVQDSPFLARWKELQRNHNTAFADREIKLAPLTAEECTELAVQLLGQSHEAIRRWALEFVQETGGNPYLLTELIGCFDPQTESFRPLPIQEMLARKLERLPAEAGRLLDVVAVTGQAIALEEVARTAGHETSPVSTITRMRTERLVRVVGREDQPLIDTYHDKIRETVLGQMEDATRRGIHRALGETIERAMGVGATEAGIPADGPHPALARVYDLAYHFDAAGETHKACVYGLHAAEQARRQFALEVAANHYAIARQNAGTAPDSVRCRIVEGYADTLMLLGRYEDATRQLAGAVDLVDNALTKARIEVLQGELACKQGSILRSIALHESGLRRLGYRVPRSRTAFLLATLWQVLVQAGHTFFPKRLHRRSTNPEHELTIRLLSRVAHPYWFQDTLKSSWAMLSALNCAEQVPPSPRLAFAYAEHSLVSNAIGLHSRASRYISRSIDLRHQLDDKWGIGQSLCYRGIGLFAAAQYEEGLTTLDEAIRMLVKTGDLWESNLAHFHKGCCHYGLGDLDGAISEARTTFETSIRIGEDSRAHSAIYLWAKATRGKLPLDQLRTCLRPLPEDICATDHLVMAEGYWHWNHGRTEEALAAFQRAYDLVKDHLTINFHTAEALPLLATALRLHADATQGEDSRHAQRLRKRALKLARWAVRITRLFPAYYPYSLRELSVQLAAKGQVKKALKYAEKSCTVAQSQKARYEEAESLLLSGRLASQLGLPEAASRVHTAEAALEAIEKPVRDSAGRGRGTS